MKFKYSEYLDEKGVKIFRPTIPIVFKINSKFIQTEAILDSGADFIILPIEMATILDIKLDINKRMNFFGAGGNSFSVYPSPEKIEHILRQNGFRTIKWSTNVFFAESQPAILLGQKGFFEHFLVTMDGKNKEVEIL